MFLLHGDAGYIDVLERIIYNQTHSLTRVRTREKKYPLILVFLLVTFPGAFVKKRK